MARLTIRSLKLTGQAKRPVTDEPHDSFVYGWKEIATGDEHLATVTARVRGASANTLFADKFSENLDGWSLFERRLAGVPNDKFWSAYRLRRHTDPDTLETEARVEGEGQNALAGMQREIVLGDDCQGKRPLTLKARYFAKRRVSDGDKVELRMWDADTQSLENPRYVQDLGKVGDTTDTNWQWHEEDLSPHLEPDTKRIGIAFAVTTGATATAPEIWVDEVSLRCGGEERPPVLPGIAATFLHNTFDETVDGWTLDYELYKNDTTIHSPPSFTQEYGKLRLHTPQTVSWSISKTVSIVRFSPRATFDARYGILAHL